eukprot:15437423-Alexandrium_andersonii.AAC.1
MSARGDGSTVLRVAEWGQAASTTKRVALLGRLSLFFDAAIVIVTSTLSLRRRPARAPNELQG